jgi:hypothetical protein
MEQFTGLVDIQNDAGKTTIQLDGESAEVRVGVMRVDVQADPGELAQGPEVAEVPLKAVAPLDPFIERISVNGTTGTVTVNAADGSPLVTIGGAEGDLIVRDNSGREVLHFNSANAELFVGATGNEGDLIVRDSLGREVLHFNSANAELFVGATGNEGDLIVRDSSGREVLHFNSANAELFVGATGNEGDIYVRNDSGADTIHLNGSSGDIILSNADAAEDFDLAAEAQAAPGAVMVLAGDGTVQPCTAAYDRKVVGVVAGAGSFRPAIVLDRRAGNDERRVPISVMGKAACRADAAYGAIEVGDLLTSSPTAGTAMRVADAPQAFGAVIGKALTPLPAGIGLVDMVIGLH